MVRWSYSDIKTNLSQDVLDWDWPTGLSLAKKNLSGKMFVRNFKLSKI